MLDTKLEFQINPNVTDQYQSQKPADCLWPHSDPQSRVTVTYYRCYRTLCTQRSDQQHNDANGRETYTPVALITNKKIQCNTPKGEHDNSILLKNNKVS